VHISDVRPETLHDICDLSDRTPGIQSIHAYPQPLKLGGRYNLVAVSTVSDYIPVLRKYPFICRSHSIGPGIVLKLIVYAQNAHRDLDVNLQPYGGSCGNPLESEPARKVVARGFRARRAAPRSQYPLSKARAHSD
jgi:hypothetical protein